MNLEKFRITHSTLIEHYQYIEAHLEGIYAALSGKKLMDGLRDVEKDSLYRIITEIKKIECKKNISVFTDEEYEQMNLIVQKRNFWCHNCYYDMIFDRKTGAPQKVEDIKNMLLDLRNAEALREKLFAKQMELFDLRRKQLLGL